MHGSDLNSIPGSENGGLAKRALAALWARAGLTPESVLPSSAERRSTSYRHRLPIWLMCGVMIALTTWIGFELELKPRVVIPIYFIVIVLLSLLDGFIASLVFSLMVAACLDFFFFEPVLSFQIVDGQDGLALITFFLASLLMTGLVRQVRRFGEAQSQHRAAFAALEISEQRYRRLFDHTPISLWRFENTALVKRLNELKQAGVADLSTYIDAHPEFIWEAGDMLHAREANAATVRMFGAKDAQELMSTCSRYWRARPDSLRRMLESGYRGERVYEERTQVNTVDGRVIDVFVSVTKAHLGVLAGFVELTDLVRAQDELQQIQAKFAHAARVSTLGELTASIAHEISQPLGAIMASGETGLRWLGRPTPDLDEVRSTLERVKSDAGRATEVIARIRSMAAPKGPERVLVSIDELVKEVLQFLQHEAQSRRVTVSYQGNAAVPKALADRTQLQQVLVNLVVNALQAIAQASVAERKIAISTQFDAASVRCIVEDSGPGINPEQFSRLFDSFFTTKEGGMGMGLSICRSIVEAHGGRISADNASAYGGARFSFELPVAGA